jgi:hypothetical protein
VAGGVGGVTGGVGGVTGGVGGVTGGVGGVAGGVGGVVGGVGGFGIGPMSAAAMAGNASSITMASRIQVPERNRISAMIRQVARVCKGEAGHARCR